MHPAKRPRQALGDCASRPINVFYHRAKHRRSRGSSHVPAAAACPRRLDSQVKFEAERLLRRVLR